MFVSVLRLFLTVPLVVLQFVIVLFTDQTHFLADNDKIMILCNKGRNLIYIMIQFY